MMAQMSITDENGHKFKHTFAQTQSMQDQSYVLLKQILSSLTTSPYISILVKRSFQLLAQDRAFADIC
jgi:hypothetical protein